MKTDLQTGKNNYPAIYLAFFGIGIVETLFPRLNGQISIVFSDEYLVRILTFFGLLLLSLLTFSFGLIHHGKNAGRKIFTGLLAIVPGLLIPVFIGKSAGGILFSALFLFSGSLFVQVASLQLILALTAEAFLFHRIALLYLLKSLGLAAGMCLPFMFPAEFPVNGIMVYGLPLVFVVAAIAIFFLTPHSTQTVSNSKAGEKFTFRGIFSDKLVILLAGGILLYSGAEFCLKDIFPFYFSETFGLRMLATGVPGMGLFFTSFLAGRLAGVYLLRMMKPGMVFLLSCLFAVAGIAAIFMGQRSISIAATLITGLGMANIFPVLLTLSFHWLRTNMALFAGLMFAVIPLGELFTSLMWAVTDSVSIAMGFVVPLFCLFFLTWIAITLVRREDV